MASNETITIFEDRTTRLPNYKVHESNLERLSEIVEPRNFSLHTDGSLRVMHYVGFFQRGNTRIQILPKIYLDSYSSKTDEKQESLDFVYRLLGWSGFLKYKQLFPQAISESNSDLLEIFVSLFATEFNSLFQRKIHKRYEERIENQQFIKGKILFSATLRANPILKHKHVMRIDDFSIDNTLNQIFKTVIHSLLLITKSSQNKKDLVIGLTYLEDVTNITLTKHLFKEVKFNRLNADFEPLFKMAQLFFFNQQPGLSSGMEKTFSFLVPINELFEAFVGKVLACFSDEKIAFTHQRNRLELLNSSTGTQIQLRPDFTVTNDNRVITILDAKYKCPFNNKGNIDLNEADVYQLCTYGLRYDIKNLFLIYPKFKGVINNASLLKEFRINIGDSIEESVNLRAIQVDITNDNFNSIVQQLKEDVYQLFIEDHESKKTKQPPKAA
jgi:5-methylcytosine-specific restriction enzyme subunit McrC